MLSLANTMFQSLYSNFISINRNISLYIYVKPCYNTFICNLSTDLQLLTIETNHTITEVFYMEDFYKITQYNGNFRIRRKYRHFPALELRCLKYNEIFQYEHAIIAELATGEYDLYLPSIEYCLSSHEYEVVSASLTLVASNISEYLTYHDIFAFKKDNAWTFLSLHNFEMELELSDLITSSLEKRLSELPKIPCEANMQGYFKSEFETLYQDPNDDQIHLAVFHADEDYLIKVKEHEVPLYDSGIQINCLGLIRMVYGGDGRFFKATYEEGESWYHGPYFDGITYGSILPMKEEAYPSIYPYKNFSGYWKKNHEGLILAASFLSNIGSASFNLRLPCPAKEVQFVKTIRRVNLYDGTDMLQKAQLWKITSADDKESFMLVSDNSYMEMSIEDFT